MKQLIIDQIIKREGGYVNNPSDSGGETNHGITKATAIAYGYHGEMCQMSRETAFEIYSTKYWDSVRGDDLSNLSNLVTAEVVDTGVNMGPLRAGKFLQRSLNVLNKRGSLYIDICVDGVIGNATISALKTYLDNRDETTLVKALNCLQGACYITLTERREKDETFVYGWLRNRVDV